jgi:hypothetical protein
VERVEKQTPLSHSFHRPLEISQTARDSHIPTAQLRARGKVENQTQVFHFPTVARDYHDGSFAQNPKNQERKSAAARPPHLTFQDHLVLETGPGFRIIFGLENAIS